MPRTMNRRVNRGQVSSKHRMTARDSTAAQAATRQARAVSSTASAAAWGPSAAARQVAAVMAERLKAIREAQQVAEIELAEGVMMKVRRHGKGARIEIPAQGQAFSTSLAIAEEMGDLIADVAK